MANPIRDNRPNIEKQADSAAYRSGYQATNPEAGINKPAMNFLNGGTQQVQQQMPMPQPQQGGIELSPRDKAIGMLLGDMQTRQAIEEGKMSMALADPLALVLATSEKKEGTDKEVSLDTLTKAQKDKILQAFIQGRDIAKEQYTGIIEPRIAERRRIYKADKEYYKLKFPQLSEYSEFCSKDVQVACEWILPGLMEAFTGTEAPLSVKGVSIEDDPAAKKIQQLIQYQLEKKNDYHGFCLAEVKTALAENWAVAKAWWKREIERVPMKKMLDINDTSDVISMTELVGQHKIEVTKVEENPEAPDLLTVYFDQILVKENHPVIEFIPSSELRYTPDAPEIQQCKFVAHRKVVRGDYLKRKERDGVYKNIDKALEEYNEGDTKHTLLEHMNDPDRVDRHRRLDDGDLASKEVELYEAYLQVDFNNDGIYEKLIVHAIGDNLIRVATNEFETPPFFICSAVYDPNAVFNRDSFSDSLEQLQDIKTALMRQIIVNAAKNNSPRIFVNDQKVDMDALLSGEEIIPIIGGDVGSNIFTPPSLPISSITMDLLSMTQTEIESQSGSTRYNQGLDAESLNKMLDINTPVPMADGSWKTLKDVRDGDLIVGKSGKPTMVLKAHKIHYPERAYIMTFSNGDVIKAGGEHLWTVRTDRGTRKTVNTDWIAAYSRKHKSGLYVDRVDAVDFGEKHLPLDPYVLGLWLGNGHSHTNRITTMDGFEVDFLKKWAEQYGGVVKESSHQNSGRAKTYDIKGTPLGKILKNLGLSKASGASGEKHIPEIYFSASFEQRLALLQGLMDTDGCHHSGSLCVFSQRGGRLLDDVIRLVKSFGWKVHKHEVFPERCGGFTPSEGTRHYQITFNANHNPFRIPRKRDLWTPAMRMRDKVKIVSIEETGLCLMRCLTVDAPDGQFCVGEHFTVTHNTASGISKIMGASEKRNKLIARSIAENFFIPIYKFMIRMNQKFLDDDQLVRITNENFSIRKEDMDIDYDLIVNVGQGAGSREQQIQYLMYTLQSIYPQLTAQGIVSAKSWYNLVVRLLEALGLRDVGGYLLDPDSPEAKQMAAQAQQAAAQAQAEALQNSLQLSIAKTSVPKVSLDMSKLPPDVVRAYLKQKLGIETTEANIHNHEEFLQNAQ